MAKSPLLETRSLLKHFDALVAVAEVDIGIKEGELTALIGPNGAGKTSLFNLICGTLKSEQGDIRFAGRSISGLSPDAIARTGLRRTFQNPRPFSGLSVLENVLLGADRHVGESLARAFVSPRLTRRRDRELRSEAQEILSLVRLDRLAHDLAGTLSGGQRKLLELARVLMGEPRMILLDEPIAGVNPTLRQELLDHIVAFHRSRRTSFFLIEHDLDFVSQVSDRIIVMADGRIIADGTPDQIWSNTAVVEAYFGARK